MDMNGKDGFWRMGVLGSWTVRFFNLDAGQGDYCLQEDVKVRMI